MSKGLENGHEVRHVCSMAVSQAILDSGLNDRERFACIGLGVDCSLKLRMHCCSKRRRISYCHQEV